MALLPIYVRGLGCLILALIVKYALSRRRHRLAAAALKCVEPPPPYMQYGDPFGISSVRDIMAADRELRVPDWMVEQQALSVQRHPHRLQGTMRVLNPPGTWDIFTVDPENLKAILATQFKDYALGETRNGNFRPLLGEGIVCISRQAPTIRANCLEVLCGRSEMGAFSSIVEATILTETCWQSDNDREPCPALDEGY
jgi:hypothetical protein